jgi:hypothetical protein
MIFFLAFLKKADNNKLRAARKVTEGRILEGD